MKKKILSIFLIIAMLIPSILFTTNAAAIGSFANDDGNNINSVAQIIDDGIWLDTKFNANSVGVTHSNIKMYNYNDLDTPMVLSRDNTIEYNEHPGEYYWSTYYEETENGEKVHNLYYTIKLGEGSMTHPYVATLLYKNAMKYNGKVYDVKININHIYKTGSKKAEIRFRAGKRTGYREDQDVMNISTYTEPCEPQIGVVDVDNNDVQVNMDLDYFIIDNDGNEIEFSGIFGLIDLDLNQGLFMNDYKITSSSKNAYITQYTSDNIDTLKYKDKDNGTYIYSSTDENIPSGADVYLKLEDINKVDTNLTWDSKTAYSTLTFIGNKINRYKKIETKVTGGTITPTITNIKDHENKTIVFGPNNPNTQYLKSIKVDGNNIPFDENTTRYVFEDITEDHKIEVVYGNIYKINYVLNGGTNDPENPTTFKDNEYVKFKDPTRNGYDFLGWYEDTNFTTPIVDFENRTSDVTVYAKWEAASDTAYKVEHYKENDEGEYELADTENLTAETNSTATAVAKNYTGYEENKNAQGRKASGTVTADGKLVLKLYYNKIKYKVTFDPKNDTTIDDQTVPYKEKAKEPTEPTKTGYTFEYWYFINDDNEEEKYDFDEPVIKDMHLIAKWKENEVTPDPTPTNDKTVTPAKKDDTVADKTISKAGSEVWISIVVIIALAGGITAYKYFKYKDIK